MDKTTGYIKLYRSIRNNWIWECPDLAMAWIDLLMMACYEDGVLTKNGRTINTERGCIYRSIRSLAERWHWSPKKVRNYLLALERHQMVTQQRNHQGTVIKIVNYSVFQDEGLTKGTTEGTTEDTTQGITQGTHRRKKERKKANSCTDGSAYFDFSLDAVIEKMKAEQEAERKQKEKENEDEYGNE